jgi:hypothetical protein
MEITIGVIAVLVLVGSVITAAAVGAHHWRHHPHF